MQASSPSTSGARCTVFFSHKSEDKLVTKHLIELLDENTENVDYFFSEKIEKGAPWRQEIVKWLDMSSYLVLVFTDPDEDWGWCLYETGFFDALSRYPNSGTERRTNQYLVGSVSPSGHSASSHSSARASLSKLSR
jgi:hypothetical protein